ncbi:MAG: CHAT domain-containing protein [Candidatus Krumholzibacteria bacterium]|nr:CHAT domain-containing protein [Candidatus Krumholzibacteria bacterium]
MRFTPFIVLAGALVALLAASPPAGAQPVEPSVEALIDSTRVLRREGRYSEASVVSQHILDRVRLDTQRRPFEVTDAEWRAIIYRKLAALSPEKQRLAARADSLYDVHLRIVRRGSFDEAVGVVETMIRIETMLIGRDTPHVAGSINRLADLHRTAGRWPPADSLYDLALSIQRKTLGREHPDYALTLAKAGEAAYALRGFAPADSMCREALALGLRAAGEMDTRVIAILEVTGSVSWENDLAEAEQMYARALALARRLHGADSPRLLRTLHDYAITLYHQHQYTASLEILDDLCTVYRARFGEDSFYYALALNARGNSLVGLRRYDEAVGCFSDAVRIERAALGEESGEAAAPLGNLGNALAALGERAEAEPVLRETVAIRTAAFGEHDLAVAEAHLGLGQFLRATGRADEAEKELRRAADIYGAFALGINEGYLHALTSLAAVRAQAGALDEAQRLLEDACARYETARTRVSARPVGRAAFADAVSPYERLARVCLAAGDVVGAWEAAERDRARVLDDMLARSGTHDGAHATERIAEPVALADVQSALGASDALLGWIDGEAPAWAYVVRHRGPVAWRRLDQARAGDAIEALRTALSDPSRSTRDLEKLARDVYQARIAPVADALEGVTRLAVVTSGDMAGIPVEVLLDAENGAGAAAVAYAPSASVLHHLASRPHPVRDGALLALADPPFNAEQAQAMRDEDAAEALAGLRRPDEDVARGAAAGRSEAIAELPRLAGTRLEVQAIAPLFAETLLLYGPHASERDLYALCTSGDIASYSHIHLATHGFADERFAERTALVLSQVDLPDAMQSLARRERVFDGRLTMGEVGREWRIDADLVTLSACQSGLGQYARGEGYVGFAHAFFLAGARGVLVSLWDVADQPTRLLMTRFYENLLQRAMPKAEALRDAKAALTAYESRPDHRPYAHPAYWAGFVLMGPWD